MSQIAAAGQQPVKLNHYLYEVPEKEGARLHSKAMAYKVLATITYVAIVAIVAAVLVVSLGLGTVTGTLPFVMFGLAITTPFLAMGAAKLREKGSELSERAQIEKGVAKELKDISSWRTAEIEQFFRDHNWSLEDVPMEALKLVCKNEPLRALLPLIARYKYHVKEAEQAESDYTRITLRKYNDRTIRFESRHKAYIIHETEAMPAALKAAVISHVLQHPTYNIAMEDLLTIHARIHAERDFDLKYDDNDTYAVFNYPKAPMRGPRRALELRKLEPAFRRLADVPAENPEEGLVPKFQLNTELLEQRIFRPWQE